MFKVGQKVVCINDTPDPNHPKRPGIKTPVKDKIYTIRDIYVTKNEKILALMLEEIINPPHPSWGRELGFRAIRFKPIDESYKFAEETLAKLEKGFKRKTRKKTANLAD